MNRFSTPSQNLTGIEKWSTLFQTINKHKIVILAIQESHLDHKLLENVKTCFGKRLMILNSQMPNNLCASRGVAFIINKSLITPIEISSHTLIEGRALALKIKWHKKEDSLLINVYAPTNKNIHLDFWSDLENTRTCSRLRKPDFLLGDFNLTKDPIDRAPAHHDNLRAIKSLRNLRHKLNLQDTWRHTHPHDRQYTYRTNNNGESIKSESTWQRR